jgi:hypothetical protein
MKLSRNIVLGGASLAVMAIAAHLVVLDRKSWRQLEVMERTTIGAQHDLAVARNLQTKVASRIPAAQQSLLPIDRVAVFGAMALYNQARAHHLRMGVMNVHDAAPGTVVLERVAKPVPGTDGKIKRIAFELKTSFDDVSLLGNFIASIPQTGGYLSAISVKGSDATLVVTFLGA